LDEISVVTESSKRPPHRPLIALRTQVLDTLNIALTKNSAKAEIQNLRARQWPPTLAMTAPILVMFNALDARACD